MLKALPLVALLSLCSATSSSPNGPLQQGDQPLLWSAPVHEGWKVAAVSGAGRGLKVYVNPRYTYQYATFITTAYNAPYNVEVLTYEVIYELPEKSAAESSGLRDPQRLALYGRYEWGTEPKLYGDKVQWVEIRSSASAWLIQIFTIKQPPQTISFKEARLK
jgi:hypothetical protein